MKPKDGKRFALFLLFLILILLFFFFSSHPSLSSFPSPTSIGEKKEAFFLWAQQDPLSSALTLFITHILSVCLIIPDSTLLSFLYGMLYPLPLALALSVLAETLGALLFFLLIRSFLSYPLIQKKLKRLQKIEKFLQKNMAFYLLFLRFSHLVPYWITNLLSATLKVPLRLFVWTTFVGVLPISYLTIEAGASFAKALKANPHAPLHDFLSKETTLLLLGIGLLSLLPILLRRWIQKNKRSPF